MMELATLNGSSVDQPLDTDENHDIEAACDKLFEGLEPLEDELRRVEEKIVELSATARSLRFAIGGIRGLREPATGRGAHDEDGPLDGFHGLAAMRKLMEMESNRLWSAPRLLEALRTRGWLSPQSSDPMRQATNRLHDMHRRGEVERVNRGVYRYVGAASGLSEHGVNGR